MEDQEKTREQLLREVQNLRRQLAYAVEPSAAHQQAQEESADSRPRRSTLEGPITFVGDFSLAQAEGVDLSETGICFEMEESIAFEIEFQMEGRIQHRKAHLVWMRRQSDGRCRWGFEFVESDSVSLLAFFKSLED